MYSLDKAKIMLRKLCIILIATIFWGAGLSFINKSPIVSYMIYRCTVNTSMEMYCWNVYSAEKKCWQFISERCGGGIIFAPDQQKNLVGYMKEREMGANDMRTIMTGMLYEEMGKNILFGNGLAAHIDLRDGKVEMLFHDLIVKIGLVGLISFFLPLICISYSICNEIIFNRGIKYKNDRIIMLQILLYSAFVALCVASYSNPYIINSVGMFFYSIIMCLASNDFL